MTSSSVSSPARRALEDFVAGRLSADRLVATVTGRFYGAAGKGEKEALRPVVELAERAAPGVVSLERTETGTGFEVRTVERVFPEASLAALRGEAAKALSASWADPVEPAVSGARFQVPAPRTPDTGHQSPARQSWLSRVFSAVRRLFSASA